MNDDVEVTAYHLEVAKKHGDKVAQAQAKHGSEGGDPWKDHAEDEVIFLVTGAKTHEVPEGYLIVEAFEEGYNYSEAWEDNNDE